MNSVHQELIEALKKWTPSGENTVDLLTNILPLSKEAAYRRLRGEILFSLDEAVVICRKINLSLDRLIEMKRENTFTFRANPLIFSQSIENYYKMLEDSFQAFNSIKDDPDSFVYAAQNNLPLTFAYKYPMLSRIKLFKWTYQLNPYSTPKKVTAFHIPEKIFRIQNRYSEAAQSINQSLLIDSNSMSAFINDIRFFETLEMISTEEILQMKKELMSLLDEMENTTKTSSFPSGKKLQIYISHTVIDASYFYIQNEKNRLSFIYLYSLNNINCDNIKMGDYQRQWIESLMRFSTLISGSGELERVRFFTKQREIVNSL